MRPQPKRALAGGAGVVSTVLDLARYAHALDAGSLASPAVMETLTTPPLDRDGRSAPVRLRVVRPGPPRRAISCGTPAGTPTPATSSLLLRVPSRGLALILLANGEGVHWDNPLDKAAVEGSPYALAFLDHFVFENK